MKNTDFMPRCAPFDTYLSGSDLVGIEIGVDVGAHAESILVNADIKSLTLVDIWDREYAKGYCEGRLKTKGYINKILFIQKQSHSASSLFMDESFDFIYIDQLHDYDSVSGDMRLWWKKLKVNGVLGYRNYADSNPDLKRAIDEFITQNNIVTVEKYPGEIVLIKE